MFFLQKQLSVLNVPSSRVAMLYRSVADIQLALPELPSQMGSAFMVLFKGGGKAQVIVALFMAKSRCNVFYVSDSGEVPVEQAEQELEAGQIFAESMGFILNETELKRMPIDQQEIYWQSLPICQRHREIIPETRTTETKSADVIQVASPAPEKSDLLVKRKILKEHLGKFLASL